MSDPEIAALRAKILSRPRSADYKQRRRDTDARGLAYGLAADVKVEKISANGVPAEWTSTPGAARDAAILYVHGGGYLLGSLDSHRHMVAETGRAANSVVLALDYRLAPEHPFPAAVEDAVAGYRFLLAQGFKPGRIALAGDSAGGGLVVAAMVAIREAGLAQPGCGWCLSPWIDMEMLGELDGIESRDRPDRAESRHPRHGAALPRRRRSALAARRAALCRPRRPPPLLIQVGAAETLLDDAIRLAQRAGAADVRVDLQVWPEMIHIWPLYYPELAGRQARARRRRRFIRQALGT